MVVLLQLVESLGITIFDALDFGLQLEEERLLSPDLKRLILAMAACGKSPTILASTPNCFL